MRAALGELIRQAAQGGVLHNDDTGMRILRLTREPGDKRTGTFTSGIVSTPRRGYAPHPKPSRLPALADESHRQRGTSIRAVPVTTGSTSSSLL
jgi:hypothetical protein